MGLLQRGTNANNPPNYTQVQLQTSSEGMVIPVIYGRNRLAPNLIWTDNFKQHKGGGKKGGGGKGGGGKTGTGTTYTAGLMLGLCEGPLSALITVTYVNNSITSASTLGLTQYDGTTTQSPFAAIARAGYIPMAYRNVAYFAANNYALGSSAAVPQHAFEVNGFLSGSSSSTFPDVNPAQIIYDLCTNTRYGLSMPGSQIGDISQYGTYCTSLNLLLSPVLDRNEQAISVFQRYAQISDTWIFWSENLLKFVPLGVSAITANGVTYTPLLTVRYDLTFEDFVSSANAPPLTVTRADPSDQYNWVKLDVVNRGNSYSTATVEWKDQTAIELYGLQQANSISASEIADLGIAGVVVGLIGARALYIRNTYKFKLSFNFVLLEPGDIVTLNDSAMGLSQYPVRIREVSENDQGDLEIVAEECPLGAGSVTASYPQANLFVPPPAIDVDPGNVNPPAVIEPPASVTIGVPQVWIGASGGAYWGGADIYASVDDVTYVKMDTVLAPIPQGVLRASLPSHADPDSTNTLAVNMIESLAVMSSSITHADADASRSLALVDNEIIAYGAVIPNGLNAYSFDLTYLRRGVYGTGIAAHGLGAPVSILSPSLMAKFNLPAAYVGVPIYLKLLSFNLYGAGHQDISALTRYSYTPSGLQYTIAAPTTPVLIVTTPTGSTSIALRLSWTASTGPSLGGYAVQFSDDGGSTWTALDINASANASSSTLSNATPGASYRARVRATSVNGLAVSPWATSSVLSAGSAPSAGALLPLVNGDIPLGVVQNTAGVPIYVAQ